jgi:hypothetical protein
MDWIGFLRREGMQTWLRLWLKKLTGWQEFEIQGCKQWSWCPWWIVGNGWSAAAKRRKIKWNYKIKNNITKHKWK